MALCYIGLGSNLNTPELQIIQALKSLHNLPGTHLVNYSSLYGSEPLGPQDQPDYLNAVALIETQLLPFDLLNHLQYQEQQQGREKLRHWGERCIDLDILIYDDLEIESERLNIPHHELENRSFVVMPLLELNPEIVLPNGHHLASIKPVFDGNLHKLSRPLIDL